MGRGLTTIKCSSKDHGGTTHAASSPDAMTCASCWPSVGGNCTWPYCSLPSTASFWATMFTKRMACFGDLPEPLVLAIFEHVPPKER